MKITFLCGSLEPGHDGVGDYTRRLGVELIRLGHIVSAVALRDGGVSNIVAGMQPSGVGKLPVLRIPLEFAEKERLACARAWIESFNPEILSLQFVIFSFHRKGLPINLSKQLAGLGVGRNWHIMFHELWVGMPTHASKIHIIWGWVQCRIIKSLVARLAPQVIHTQSALYQKQLARLGLKVASLPLFSNIPVSCIRKQCIEIESDVHKNENDIRLVVFGSLHPYSQVETLVKEAVRLAKNRSANVVLQAVGRCGSEIERWTKAWHSAGLRIDVVGEQPPERISEVLRNASIGITTTALPMVQKSGSVAAMQEHGLPVVCVSKPWQPRDLKAPPPPAGVFELREGVLEDCLSSKVRNKVFYSAAEIASLFVESIEKKCVV